MAAAQYTHTAITHLKEWYSFHIKEEEEEEEGESVKISLARTLIPTEILTAKDKSGRNNISNYK